jgi:hypothetical protein
MTFDSQDFAAGARTENHPVINGSSRFLQKFCSHWPSLLQCTQLATTSSASLRSRPDADATVRAANKKVRQLDYD